MDQRLKEMKVGLDQQMYDRDQQIKQEIQNNQAYMKKVLDQAAEDQKKQEEKDKARKNALLDNQKFIRTQIEVKQSSPDWKVSPGKALMNEDEIRFNKDIVNWIASNSAFKK